MEYKRDKVVFETLSGDLVVEFENDLIKMDFPARMPTPKELPEAIAKSLNILPKEVLKARDYVLVYESEKDIRAIQIDRTFFDQINLGTGGVIVTAVGDNSDFVSRFFTPQATILEDPVTGSAHCSLIPFWAERLNKIELVAIQASDRQGMLYCEHQGDRVAIRGKAKTYSIGNFWLE